LKALIFLSIALLTGACADLPLNQSGPSLLEQPAVAIVSGPHALVPTAASSTVSSTALDTAASCSDGQVPSFLPTGTHDNSASLTWRALAGIRDYGLAIERMDVTNVRLLVSAFVVNDVTTVTVTLGAGTYYARVRTRSCGVDGPWSGETVFSVDEGEPVPALAGAAVSAPPVAPLPPGTGGGSPACHQSSSADTGNQHQICGERVLHGLARLVRAALIHA
jgi:hypothetical protein